MPYIKQSVREDLLGRWPINAGELNYIFTLWIIQYLKTNGESYQSYNDVVGVLECCKQELYRRKTAPYEDKKINSNGDVYVK